MGLGGNESLISFMSDESSEEEDDVEMILKRNGHSQCSPAREGSQHNSMATAAANNASLGTDPSLGATSQASIVQVLRMEQAMEALNNKVKELERDRDKQRDQRDLGDILVMDRRELAKMHDKRPR